MSRYRSYGKLDDKFITEGDTFFLRMNARLRPNQLKPGEVALSKNGRMNDDGTWQPRKGLSTLFGAITSGENSIRLPYTIQSAQRNGGVVTIVLNETPSLSFIPGDNIHVADLDSSANGTQTLASVNFTTKTITYANAGSDTVFSINGEGVGNTSVVSAGTAISTTLNFTLNDDGVNEVFGSAVFSDAASDSDDYILTATDTVCIIFRLKDSALFKCRYDGGGESVDGPVNLTQGLGKMFIFRTNQTTLEASPKVNLIEVSSASQAGNLITVNTSSSHGRVVNDFVTLSGFGNYTENPNDCYQIETVVSPTSFKVRKEVAQTATFNVSGAKVEYFDDFTKVANGTYTAPVYLTDTTATASNGEVTMDVTAHGLSAGDTLTIQAGASPFDGSVDQSVRVTSVPSVNQFTFNLNVVDGSASLTVSKPLAIGKGFIHQPAAPWGVVHERRLWLPYWYTSATSPADREIRDEIVASDIMDFNTFDVIGNQFRPTAGQSDFTVQLTPFTKDSLVIFNRKSIHLMTGISGSLADVKSNVVTTEIGCSARKSVVQVANQIMF